MRFIAGLSACLTGAVQHGDPEKGAAVPLARRPDGCTPWHWHTQNEHTTMIRGRGKMQMREDAAQNLSPGDYYFMPSRRSSSSWHQQQITCTTSCTFYKVIDATFDHPLRIDKDGKEISPDQVLKTTPKKAVAKQPTPNPRLVPHIPSTQERSGVRSLHSSPQLCIISLLVCAP
jgi:gentisate 1,2-dioxygenase